jgi:hypothetical protein
MSDPTFQIPKDVIEPIIRSQVEAGIMAQIGDPVELIRSVIDTAISQKVGVDGKISRYSCDNKYNILETLTRKRLHEAVCEAIEKWVDNAKPQITKAVETALKRRNTAIAKALVNGFVDATKSEWRCSVSVEFPNR